VLDTGSLAILVSAQVSRETERVILRIDRNGSVADTSVPADDFRKLVSVSGSLLAVGEESVARVDINGRRMDWQTPTRIGWRGRYPRKVQAVSVQRAGIAQIVLAGDNIIERYALADGRLLGSCNLSPGYPVLDMIGDASGNVRALVSRPARAGEGGRRGMLSMDLRDDCADPTAAAVDLGARLPSYGVVSLERLSTAQFSAYGTHVHEASGYRARRSDVRAVTEFEILRALMEQAGYVLTRGDLVRKALGSDFLGLERSLDSHMRNLRAKIEADPRNPRYIKTVYGVGYRLEEQPHP
jgi:hypothetical protein